MIRGSHYNQLQSDKKLPIESPRTRASINHWSSYNTSLDSQTWYGSFWYIDVGMDIGWLFWVV